MVDRDFPAEELVGIQAWDALTEGQQADLLALRGLLAGRLILHCLQKRHSVDFGINRWVLLSNLVVAATTMAPLQYRFDELSNPK